MNDRKHQYPARPKGYIKNSKGFNPKQAPRMTSLTILLVCYVLLFLAVLFIGFKQSAGAAPLREANCWQNDSYTDLVVVDSPVTEINVVFEGTDQHKTFYEFWCRPNKRDFTAEIMVANSPWEIQRLRMWFNKYDYKNAFLFCRSGDKAWTIADLEDYSKKRTSVQIAGYNSWATAYAARNNCRTKG